MFQPSVETMPAEERAALIVRGVTGKARHVLEPTSDTDPFRA